MLIRPRSLSLVAVLLCGLQDPAPLLTFDQPVAGVIEDEDPVVETETLVARYTIAPTVGQSFRIEVDESGPVTIELRSYFFDAYLVLRDAEGELLAEDDDGLLGTHSRIVAPHLEAGKSYPLEACALHGKRGPFELVVVRGEPAALSSADRATLELHDAERRVAAIEAFEGVDSVGLATALYDLGFIYYRRGSYESAIPFYERSLAIRERALGPEHPDTATSLDNLAALLQAQGDYAAARPLLERALAIREGALGPEHPDTAASLNNLGRLLEARGDYAAARPLHERALAIREGVLGPEHPDTALSLNTLAMLLSSQGDFAAARPLHERALAIYEKALGPEHPETASSLNNLAALLQAQGDYARARPLYQRALAIYEGALGPEHPNTATSLNNLAALLESQRDFAAARPLLERALAIREGALGPEHPDTATSLNNLAWLLRAQGDYAGARPLLERAISIYEGALGPEHPWIATSLNNLALLLATQSDYAGARPLLERALAINEGALGPEHPDIALSLNSLAWLLRAQGDHAGARPLFERAISIFEGALGPEHPDTALSLDGLALLLVDLGESRDAWELVQRAQLGRKDRIGATLAAMSEGERYPYLAELFWQLELQLSVARLIDEPRVRVAAYEALLDWKGRVGRLLMASREQLAARMSAEERALVEELRSCQVELSRLAFGTDIRDRQVRDRRLAELRAERGRLERELQRHFGSSDVHEVAGFEELRAGLEPGSVLIDFFVHRVYEPGDGVQSGWGPDRLTAWIVRSDRREPIVLDLGPAADVGRAVAGRLGDLDRDSGALAMRGVRMEGSGHTGDGAELRRVLWDPIAEYLEGVTTVFVSPDSFLATLPLEILQLEDGSFLLEHLNLVYLQDATALTRDSGSSPGYAALLSVGGVDFRERARWDLAEGSAPGAESALRGSLSDAWPSLPGTESESRAIHDLHGEVFDSGGRRLLLQGGEPSEARLKHELPRHRVLHLATHGFFQPEGMPSMWEAAKDAAGKPEMRMSDESRRLVGMHPGLLSGLVCAGANRVADPGDEGGDDGYLTAEEVGWLDLSGVELVVLSACETGLGRPQSGEGLIGLRRAFQTAGAKTVISSLWSVKDESTAELMGDFYKNLWLKGMGRREALRTAQLAMLARNRMEHGEALPSTWGAFVLSGEWR